MNFPQADTHSVTGCLITMLAGIGTTFSQAEALFVITMMTGISTVVYNVVKIRNEWKRKK